MIHHYESGSSETTEAVKAAIANNRAKFVDKWSQQLEQHLVLAGEHVPYARIAQRAGGARILYWTTLRPELWTFNLRITIPLSRGWRSWVITLRWLELFTDGGDPK